jgi:DNA-binding HxlR family transcriptional regulator
MSTCKLTGLKLFGDFWSLRILEILGKTGKRFCEIERLIPDTNPSTLTKRLKKLVNLEIIYQEQKTIDKISVVYKLTKKGEAVMPILRRIKKYSENYL